MTDNEKIDLNKAWLASQPKPLIEPPRCDVEKYRKHLETLDLTPDEEAALLHDLWHIMAAFVDMGFGVDSMQLLANSDDKSTRSGDNRAGSTPSQSKLIGGLNDN